MSTDVRRHRSASLGVTSAVVGAISLWCATAAAQLPYDRLYPYRTEKHNAHKAWYRPQPLEFPPPESFRTVEGRFLELDFILRKGKLQAADGTITDFFLPPYGAVMVEGSETDLRDVPLATPFICLMHEDSEGRLRQLTVAYDRFSRDARYGWQYRLDELNRSEGKLRATVRRYTRYSHDSDGRLKVLDKPELIPGDEKILFAVNEATRVWKGDKQATLDDLVVGDEFLPAFSGDSTNSGSVRLCTDIWADETARRLATERRRAKFIEFTKARGMAGWITKTEGNKIVVELFAGDKSGGLGDSNFADAMDREFQQGKDVRICVANEDLRTWNPAVDGERGTITTMTFVGTGSYGTAGLRPTIQVTNMLEGFRRGRIVRVFGTGWKAQDQNYGESLMGYGFGRLLHEDLKENPAKEYPEQFPFRTDYGNTDLPWYRLRPGVQPPPFAEHVVYGRLTAVDPSGTSGKLIAEGTGDESEFSLLEKASVQVLGMPAKLAELPLGSRCRFHLYQDEQGKFTRALLVSDEYSRLVVNHETYRITKLDLAKREVYVARQMPEVKDYNGDMKRPPDIGARLLFTSAETKVLRDGAAPAELATLADLRIGDVLRVNLSGQLPGRPAQVTEIHLGDDAPRAAPKSAGR